LKEFQLKRLKNFSVRDGPLLLIIMDGIGLGIEDNSNAFFLAKTPYLDMLQTECPKMNLYCELKAHGTAVGLPTDNEMGNSEVGHNAMGGGQVVKQRAFLAKEAILSKQLFNSLKWKELVKFIHDNNSALHFIGLLSDGYVHSHISHLFNLLKGAAESHILKVRVHILLDGRDVLPQSALVYVDLLERNLVDLNSDFNMDYKIASGGGRMHVTMDRYNSDWKVVENGWNAHVRGIPDIFPEYPGYFFSAEEAINTARMLDQEISDQYLPSFVIIDKNNRPVGKIESNDAVLFFNYRGDRAIQISRAFEESDFDEFDRVEVPQVKYYGLLEYDEKSHIPKNFLIEPPRISNPSGKYICAMGISQFAIAETHKFGHVTYFWNGNNEGYIDPNYEKYIEIKSDPSEMIRTNPKMKAYEVLEETKKALLSNKYKYLRVNFANGDMVGHTGDIDAAIVAAETVDDCVSQLVQLVKKLKGIAIVTADHGNLDEMMKYKTAHTLNSVMFAIIDFDYNREYIINNKIKEPGLGNITATILNLLGYEKPEGYLDSLIKFLI